MLKKQPHYFYQLMLKHKAWSRNVHRKAPESAFSGSSKLAVPTAQPKFCSVKSSKGEKSTLNLSTNMTYSGFINESKEFHRIIGLQSWKPLPNVELESMRLRASCSTDWAIHRHLEKFKILKLGSFQKPMPMREEEDQKRKSIRNRFTHCIKK